MKTTEYLDSIKSSPVFEKIADECRIFFNKRRDNLNNWSWDKLTETFPDRSFKSKSWNRSLYKDYVLKGLIVSTENNLSADVANKNWETWLNKQVLYYVASKQSQLIKALETKFTKYGVKNVESDAVEKDSVEYSFFVYCDKCTLHLRTIVANGDIRIMHHRFICTKHERPKKS